MNRPSWIQALHLNTTSKPDEDKRADLLNLYRIYRALDGVEDAAVVLRTSVLNRLAPFLGLPVSPESTFPSTLVVTACDPNTVLLAGLRYDWTVMAHAISVVGECYVTGTSFSPRCLVSPPVGTPRWERTLRLLAMAHTSANHEEVRGAKGYASAFTDPSYLRTLLSELCKVREVVTSTEEGYRYSELREKLLINFMLRELCRTDEETSRSLLSFDHKNGEFRVGGKPYGKQVILGSIDRVAVSTIQQLAHHPGEWNEAGEWVGGNT